MTGTLFPEDRLRAVVARAYELSAPPRPLAARVLRSAVGDTLRWMEDNGSLRFWLGSLQEVRIRLTLSRTKFGWLHDAPWRGHSLPDLIQLREAMQGRPVPVCRGGSPGARGGRSDCEGIAAEGEMVCPICARGAKEASAGNRFIDVEHKKRAASAGLRRHGRGRF